MSITGRRDDPSTPLGTTVVDYYTEVYLAFAILVALHYRNRTETGQKIEGDLLSGAMALKSQEVAVAANTGAEPTRSENGIGHVYNQTSYGVYETSHGYLVLSLSIPAEIGEVLDIDALEGVTSWEAYECRDEIKERIESVLRTEPTEHWLGELWEHDIRWGPVNDLTEAIDHPEVRANDMVETVEHPTISEIQLAGVPDRFSETPGGISRHPPMLGKHTEEVFEDAGYSLDRVTERRTDDASE